MSRSQRYVLDTKDQVAGLRMIGCQVAKGSYFSQPLRAEEFGELLTRHFARTVRPAGPVLIDQGAGMPGITAGLS